MSAARADPDLLARITEWVGDGALALADLGYEGEPDIFRMPFKKPADTTLTVDQQAYQHRPRRPALPGRTRQLPDQDHIQSSRPLSRLPLALGRHRRGIVGAALVLLHHENHRTT